MMCRFNSLRSLPPPYHKSISAHSFHDYSYVLWGYSVCQGLGSYPGSYPAFNMLLAVSTMKTANNVRMGT